MPWQKQTNKNNHTSNTSTKKQGHKRLYICAECIWSPTFITTAEKGSKKRHSHPNNIPDFNWLKLLHDFLSHHHFCHTHSFCSKLPSLNWGTNIQNSDCDCSLWSTQVTVTTSNCVLIITETLHKLFKLLVLSQGSPRLQEGLLFPHSTHPHSFFKNFFFYIMSQDILITVVALQE